MSVQARPVDFNLPAIVLSVTILRGGNLQRARLPHVWPEMNNIYKIVSIMQN